MSWGVDDLNLDGNNGWSWQTGKQSSGWESGASASGWGSVQYDSPTLPSTSISRIMDDGDQDKERKASSSYSMITGQESVLAGSIKEQKRDSISIQASRKLSSASTKEQSTLALKENNDAGRASSATPTELSSIGSSSRNHLMFSDPMQAFNSTVKTLQDAVRLQIESNQASAELDQWRRTQNSEAYGHPTLATRKKLEDKRAEIGIRQGEAQKLLKHNISTLAYISSPIASNIRYVINDTEMTRFRNELEEWMQKASQHLTMQEKPKKEPEQSVEEPAEQLEPEQPSVFLKQPSEWVLDDIAKALAELDDRADTLAEEIFWERERPKLLDEALVNEVEVKKGQFIENDGESTLLNLVVQSEEQYQRIDDRLLVSAEKVTALLQERARLKNEMAASAASCSTLKAMHRELTDCVEESERLITRDEEQLAELTKSVQSMLISHPPSPGTKFDTDELLPQLQAKIIPQLEDELAPVIQYFKSACLQHDQGAQSVVDKIVHFIANRMDDVAKAAQARTKVEVSLER